MRVISNKTLLAFADRNSDSSLPMQVWRKIIESREFLSFADLKSTFNATDKVGSYYVFDIGGNKFRIVTSIHFNTQKVYIRHLFTHKEYDKWKP